MSDRRFFGIFDPSASRDARLRKWLLRRAVVARGITWVPIHARAVQFSALPEPHPGDMVFGFTRDVNRIERLLLRPWAGTCYQTFDAGLSFPPPEFWTTIHAAHGLPMPTTVHGLGTKQQDLATLVDTLDGFPIVIKEEGLSQGRGVNLVRTLTSSVQPRPTSRKRVSRSPDATSTLGSARE